VKVILFGATGMIGSGVLIECLEDPRVTDVLAVGRSSTGLNHPKLREIIHEDFTDYTAIIDDLSGYDACFFCLGVSAAGMKEKKYHYLTYELTLSAAEVLAGLNSPMTFCYTSAAGADSTEEGRIMWARVRGKIENRLMVLFKAAYLFRPGYVQPLKGVRSRTFLYRATYAIVGPLYPIIRRVVPGRVTTTENLGRAMIQVAAVGCPHQIIDPRTINELAAASRQALPAPPA
jgi:uncharacterized protein YbjT (DUF2867 family)